MWTPNASLRHERDRHKIAMSDNVIGDMRSHKERIKSKGIKLELSLWMCPCIIFVKINLNDYTLSDKSDNRGPVTLCMSLILKIYAK